MDYNYHTHTSRCGHATGSDEEYVKRAIEQGGVTVDGEKLTDVRATVTEAQLKEGVLIKRGKKSFNKFILV